MEYLNKYTRENNLVLNLKNIKPKYICQLCRGVLCEPRVTKCKCSFCEACISSYASSTAETTLLECPKCGKDIDKNVDIFPNVLIEDKLENLQLECPLGGCNESVALKCMREHLEECTRGRETCPLARLGCGVTVQSSSELNVHLINDLGHHFDLVTRQMDEKAHLIEIVQNINAEQLKKIEDGDRALKEAKFEIDKLKADNQNLQERLLSFESEFNTMKSEVTSNINMLRTDIKGKMKKIDSYEKENEKLKDDISKAELKMRDFEQLFQDHQTFNSIKSDKYRVDENKFTFKNILSKPNASTYYSPVFIVNGYMFKVRMCIEQADFINFYVLSLRNHNSNTLIWPIPYKMSLEILDRNGRTIKKTDFCHAKAKFPTDYENPTNNNLYLNDSRIKLSNEQANDECTVVFNVFIARLNK